MGVLDRWRTPVAALRAGDGGVDRYGNKLPGERREVQLPAGLFEAAGSTVTVEKGANTLTTQPAVCWLGAGEIDVRESDQLKVAGELWQVDGLPERTPLGTKVRLKRVQKRGV